MRAIATALAMIGLAGALALGARLGNAPPAPRGAATLVASAPEAGLLALAAPAQGRIRILYARDGGMILLREISVPRGEEVRELALSADGRDLFVATPKSGYALSTRTGRVEAQTVATGADPYAARWSAQRRG